MAKEHPFRFAVRNKMGQHSQQWRIWTRNNDCYIGSRGITHSYKASFHESGQCQVGLSSEIRSALVAQPGWENESRLYDQWKVDIDLSSGSSIKLLELIIPNSQLDKFEEKTNNKVKWITCAKSKAVSIGIFKANISAEQRVATVDETNAELCRLPLSNGYSILVLARIIDEKKEYNKFINAMLNGIFPIKTGRKTFVSGTIDTRCPGIRAMIWHKNQEGRYWIETSLRKTFEICGT
jgi:hypothetical protein